MQSKNVFKSFKDKIKNVSPLTIVLCIVLILYSLTLFALLGWGFMSSFKGRYEVIDFPFSFPEKWLFTNYITAFQNFFVKVKQGGEYRYAFMEEMLLYSALYSFGCAVVKAYVTCIVAYVTAKFYHFAFSKILYSVVLVVMMLPIVGSLPSELAFAHALGLYDHVWGMWIMQFNFLGMYYFVFHAMFRGVPKDFADAAYIDGASEWTVMLKVMLPMAKNTLLIVILLGFIGYWNDYQTPMLFMPNYPTLANGLYQFSLSTDGDLANVPMKLTGCFVLVIPVLILFLIFKDKLIGNISMGGLKE